MKPSSVEIFREMIGITKAVIRHVWGTGGIGGLSGPQFGLLMHLRHQGPLFPSEIADRMLVTQGNITGLIQRLQKQGFVERRRSSTDRRFLKIGITEAGQAKLDEITPQWESQVRNSFRNLNPSDHQTLLNLLEKLKNGLPENLFCTSNARSIEK